MGTKQANNEPGPGKEKLAPLEGGVKDLERYYRSMLRVSYCLFLPLGVAIVFTARGDDFLFIAFLLLPISLLNRKLGEIVLYATGTSNGDKAGMWWDLVLQARKRMLACFVCGLLAYILLQALSQVHLGTLLLSENFWHGLFACALMMTHLPALALAVQSRSYFVGLASSKPFALWKDSLMALYFCCVLLLIMTGQFAQAVFFALAPFSLVLLLYLRYRASGSPQRLEAMHDTLQLTAGPVIGTLTMATLYWQYLDMIAREGSVALRPLPVGQLASGWLLPLGLMIMLDLAHHFAQRERIRRGLFATSVPPLPAQASAKEAKHYHQRLKWYLELEQRQPILRKPRHLAWIRMVIWLGPRAWLVGLLSSLAMVALVLG